MSLFEDLINPENCDNISLCGPDGEDVEFEQIAVIPMDETVYFILCPVVPMGNMKEDQALVFFFDDDPDRLILCEEEQTIRSVFEVYFQMIEEAQQADE